MNKKQVGKIRESIREEHESLTCFLAVLWEELNIPEGLDVKKTRGKKIEENVDYFVNSFNSLPTSEEKANFFDDVHSFVDECYSNIQVAVDGLSDHEYGRVMDPYTDKLVDQISVASAYLEDLNDASQGG